MVISASLPALTPEIGCGFTFDSSTAVTKEPQSSWPRGQSRLR